MNALEIKLATAIARDRSIDLDNENDEILYGVGCHDFVPVQATLRVVAKLMRYQCTYLNGGWDCKQYNEDLPGYRKNVTIIDLNVPELRAWLVSFVQSRMNQAKAA